MDKLLKIFLIEDSPRLREQLIECLQEVNGITVIGHAEDEQTAILGLQTCVADLVIVDLELKSGTGVGVLQALREDPERFHNVAPVVLTTYSHPRIFQRCMELGVHAFFDKAMQIDDLISFVEKARR